MDALDKQIINTLQGGFPVCDKPFAEVAGQLAVSEAELIARIQRLLDNKTLSRFGPMYDIQKLGGAFSLCAMQVPAERFAQVTEIVNGFEEVAHNYQRDHAFNMWFVLATETPAQIQIICDTISRQTGLRVYNMPKIREFFVGLHFTIA